MKRDVRQTVLDRCQASLRGWRGLTVDDFDFDDPKGFSSFTIGVRCLRPEVAPAAALYRQLEGKENALLDFDAEQRVYLALAEAGVAAHCHAYERDHRIEAFYDGRTLTRHDLSDHRVLRGVGQQLARLHAVQPGELPGEPFFERLVERWEPLARRVLVERRAELPEHEQDMCERLMPILGADTRERVRRCLPDSPLGFCHNDTYHGNVFMLRTGEIRLLDFEFSCAGHRAFDVANLFAETVMRHGLDEYPHFSIAEPEFTDAELGAVVDGCLEAREFTSEDARTEEASRWVAETRQMLPLSDYMYAMAALPLALAPIQKIAFVPYALQRFERFLSAS